MSKNFDTSDFDNKMNSLKRVQMPRLIERGLGAAAAQLLNDSINIAPTVPIKEGWLRGSGSFFVNNKFWGVSPSGRPGKATTSHYEPLKKGENVAVVGFNAPYAEKLHESKGYKFSEPSSGPKFLSRKLQFFKQIYLKIIADTIKRGL